MFSALQPRQQGAGHERRDPQRPRDPDQALDQCLGGGDDQRGAAEELGYGTDNAHRAAGLLTVPRAGGRQNQSRSR
ncbi:MAG TPA: hypothetical protein VFJ07_02230, partial [Streptosporangiaceae bacterium]|nr:hypothetical protein [Streptosporangiaceae bacterium]